MDYLDSTEWLMFLRLFPAVEKLHLSGDVVPYIASALEDIYRGDAPRSDASAPLAVVRRGQKEGQRARWIHRAVPLFAPALWSPCYCRQHAR
jgi:hypothetical protein